MESRSRVWDRITRIALRTLEEAFAEGSAGVVQGYWGCRLAVEWLIAIKAARPWQAGSFLEVMSEPIHDTSATDIEHYIRFTRLNGALEHWHAELGIPRASMFKREQWAKAYAPEFVDTATGRSETAWMCNRYSPGDRQQITNLFKAQTLRDLNDGPAIVHPREPGWVIRNVDGELVLDQMTWGFPVVLKGKRGQPLKPKPVNNARFDKLNQLWRNWACRPEHRCLIPATRYAEAQGPAGHMTTTWLSLRSAPVFAWAGLWRDSSEWGSVYTGVMTGNAPELCEIHDRSPVILAPDEWDEWLNAPLEALKKFDRPWPAEDVVIDRTDVLWSRGGR